MLFNIEMFDRVASFMSGVGLSKRGLGNTGNRPHPSCVY